MSIRLIQGHCLETLRTLADESVNCVVTSPPYWALRDYGTEPVAWPALTYSPMPGVPACIEVPEMRSSLGLEHSLEDFIGHIVAVFREVRRVLRKDGVCWVNMGDSYAGSRCGGDSGASTLRNPGQKIDASSGAKRAMTESARRDREPVPRSDTKVPGLKPKDLVGQPWRVAFALQADGWWLRQDVVWEKLNPMPESCNDRCTKAHEYVFMLTKSERYWSNFAAIKEPASLGTHARYAANGGKPPKGAAWGFGDQPRDAVELSAHKASSGYKKGAARKLAEAGSGTKNNGSFDEAMAVMPAMRNMRDVWPLASEPFKEAHFATFPSEIPRRCIEATCPVGGVVLDIFNGSGTTGKVAHGLGRQYIGLELSASYIELSNGRMRGTTAGLPLEVTA